MIEILMAAVIFLSAGGCVLYVLAYPRTGFWRCRRCTVIFEGVEPSTCTNCRAHSGHKFLGEEWGRW